jgi:hypothetical protein
MSHRDAFKESVNVVDGCFCEASAEESGTRFVVACEVDSSASCFKLSLYDLTRQRLAERENSFDMTDRARAMHRIATWSEYFDLVHKAFRKGTVLVGEDGKTLTLILYLPGRQVSLKFDLLPVDGEFVKKKAAQLVLRMLHVARRVFELDDEIVKLRADLEHARRPLASPGASVGGFDALEHGSPRAQTSRSPMRVGGMLPGAAAAARSAPPKRLPGMSIVNPRSRRRVITGAKLVHAPVSPSSASAATAAAAASSTARPTHNDDNDDNDDDDDATEERNV